MLYDNWIKSIIGKARQLKTTETIKKAGLGTKKQY
jgi:hypothetical protein